MAENGKEGPRLMSFDPEAGAMNDWGGSCHGHCATCPIRPRCCSVVQTRDLLWEEVRHSKKNTNVRGTRRALWGFINHFCV